VAAGQLRSFHGDPGDRIIYATAAARKLPLVTKDARFRRPPQRSWGMRARGERKKCVGG
jgi:PIN domain nuclease of toxin-antitoxin system